MAVFFPQSLKAEARWVLWRYNAEQKKLPYQAQHPEDEAKVNDPTTWADYESARAALEAGNGDGLGFVLGEGWAGVDLDDVRDPDSGRLTPAAKAIVEQLDSYAEVSPSGTGVKIFVKAWIGKNHARKGLEVYGARRYFTVTGLHLAVTPTEPQARTDEMQALLAKEFGAADEPDEDETDTNVEIDDAGDEDEGELHDGGRNNALARIGGSLRRIGLGDDELLAALLAVNKTRCKPPLGEREVETIARSVGRYAPSKAERAIDWMNSRHAVIVENGKTIVITEKMDTTFKRIVLVRRTFEDIRNFYLNKTVTLKAGNRRVVKRLGEYWLSHPGRREFTDIVFEPERTDLSPDIYNLWRGFHVTPRKGSWSCFREHLYRVGCAGSDEVFRYQEGWLARLVQRPGLPGEVALVMRGPQGAGKGMIARAVGHLFGQHFLHVSQIRHLVGHFNAHLQDAVLVLGDEAIWGGDKASQGALKTLITEPTLFIERKGKDAFAVPNRVHLMMATNNEWAVPMDMDDRRFCVVDVPGLFVNRHDYFKQIRHELLNGGYEAMLHDLLAYDLTKFNHRKPPKTDAGLDQKLQGLSPVERWWFDKLNKGRVLPWHHGWPQAVSRTELHDDYVVVLQKAGISRRATETELAIHLRERLVKGIENSRRMMDVRVGYDGNGRLLTEKRQERCWLLPSLAECRKRFEALLQQPAQWETDAAESDEDPQTELAY